MTKQASERINSDLLDTKHLSPGEQEELVALGMLTSFGQIQPPAPEMIKQGQSSVISRAISNASVLNEACEYGSAFSRGLRVELQNYTLLLISGTASVDEVGATIHKGDFRAQCWRTYRNITALLEQEGATWKDIVKCTCYLRDIERDYDEFNAVRTAFFNWLQLDPLPASVGIQARLCREDLFVEIEAMAILKKSQD